MQAVSDALCREYGLSVIENPQPGKGKHYGEWRAEQEQRPTWRGIVRSDVDAVIRQSMTERQFFENLHRKGYEVKVGKDISVRPPGKERFVRLARNLVRLTRWRVSADGFWSSPERCAPCRSLPQNTNTIMCPETGVPQKGDWLPGIVFSLLLSSGGVSQEQATKQTTAPFSS